MLKKRERNKNENDRFKKNENEIRTKMIDGKTDKNDNEKESLNENSTVLDLYSSQVTFLLLLTSLFNSLCANRNIQRTLNS